MFNNLNSQQVVSTYKKYIERSTGERHQLLHRVPDADLVSVHVDEGGLEDVVRRDEDGAGEVRR